MRSPWSRLGCVSPAGTENELCTSPGTGQANAGQWAPVRDAAAQSKSRWLQSHTFSRSAVFSEQN